MIQGARERERVADRCAREERADALEGELRNVAGDSSHLILRHFLPGANKVKQSGNKVTLSANKVTALESFQTFRNRKALYPGSNIETHSI